MFHARVPSQVDPDEEDLNAEAPEHQYSSHTAGVYKVKRHHAREGIFASCSVDCTVKIWDVEIGKDILFRLC